tara:strand:+ start:12777 stop:13916 length:1140 start_codon:yes stop_codon:yes gene_type:complete
MKFNNFKKFLLLAIIFSLNQFFYAGLTQNLESEKVFAPRETLPRDLDKKIGEDYLLGPGDAILLKVFGLPELSGEFGIGPDGMLYLPQIQGILVNLVSIKELKSLIVEKYKKILMEPNINLQLAKVRPVRVFLKGEVKFPGFYNLSIGGQNFTINSIESQSEKDSENTVVKPMSTTNLFFPTIFDALKMAKGITPYTDLSEITVVRNNSISNGGGKIQTKLNFLSLFVNGDQSQNIRLFDGDTIIVSRSDKTLKEQFLEVNKTNLNPLNVSVFVSGKVKSGGFQTIPKGSGLNQAIAMSGGKDLVSGKIEFIRFLRNGEIDKRVIGYNKNSSLDSFSNPILEDGDIINVKDSLFGASTEVLNKVLQPLSPILIIRGILD